jgi:4-amino-4-deoxy-L-arabinose transferase-like glycosyltransferase
VRKQERICGDRHRGVAGRDGANGLAEDSFSLGARNSHSAESGPSIPRKYLGMLWGNQIVATMNSHGRDRAGRKGRGKVWASAVGIFLASVAVTSLFWLALPAGMRPSQGSVYPAFYEPVARNILKGSGLVLPGGGPALRYPPGYPLLVAGALGTARLTGISESTILAVLALASAGVASTLIFLFSYDSWGMRGGWISGLLFATYPFLLWLTKQPNSESPFLVFLVGSVYAFWLGFSHSKHAVLLFALSGALVGIAMLIRPIAVGVGFLLAGIVLCASQSPLRRRLLLAFVLLVANLVVLLPWEGWAHGATGQWIPLSTGGVPSIRDGLTFSVENKGYRSQIPTSPDVLRLERDLAERLSPTTSFDALVRVIVQVSVDQPGTVAKLLLMKAARSWYATDSGTMETPALLLQAGYLSLFVASTALLWRRRVALRMLAVIVWLNVIYFWLITTTVLSIVRYMTPVLGLCFLFPPAIFRSRQA